MADDTGAADAPQDDEPEHDDGPDHDAGDVLDDGAGPDHGAEAKARVAQVMEAVLAYVRRPAYQPVKPRVIAKKLGLQSDRVVDVRRAVKKLVKQGQLAWGPKHLVVPLVRPTAAHAQAARHRDADGPADAAPPAKSPAAAKPAGGAKPARSGHGVTGIFRRTQQGFGFVRPSGTAPSAGRTQDIFIPAEDCGDAASGDTVLVRLAKDRRGGEQPRGQIVEIIERDTRQFVGTYFEAAGAAFVTIDGSIFARPVGVGDPGAKGVRPDDKVVVEMVRFPTHVHDGEGVIVEVLGPAGAPGVDTLTILREFELPEEFAPDALDEARAAAEAFREDDLAGRLDLTGLVTVTIDPVNARDFDDAVSVERLDNGHWRLGVHIADVSHFVRPKTALDREAHARATSVYLPDRVVPMLPELISNGLASLQPDRVRYTQSCFIELTSDGAPVAVDLHLSAIRSRRRFTYEEVDAWLEDPQPWRAKLGRDVFELLERMRDLAAILRRRRMGNGSLELQLDEVAIDLDREGRVIGAHREVQTVSHQIIEDFMLAANRAVAERLREVEWPFLRRVHELPDPRKMRLLTEFVASLGFEVENLENRFELQRLLDHVAALPEKHAVNYAVLRAMQQAVYSPIDEGHYALAFECYTHFTSPIRRYPDLSIHRLVRALFQGKKPDLHFDDLLVLGEHCSERERRAAAAERELVKLKLLIYLNDRVGEELDALVNGVEPFGLFVQGIELPAEGLVPAAALVDDVYRFDRTTHTLTGRRAGRTFRLGDRLRVVVARVDLEQRLLEFRLAESPGTRSYPGSPSRPPRKGPPEPPEVPRRPGRGANRPRGPAKPRGPRKGPPKGKRRK